MDAIQNAYDDMINRVFELAYIDLVDCIIKERKETKLANTRAITAKQSADHLNEAKNARLKREWIEEWFDDVIPRFRDLDSKRFKAWAIEEADEYERTGHRRNHRLETTDD